MPIRIIDREQLQIRVYQNADELAVKAARYFARVADRYIVGCGRLTVVLAGGSTPKKMLSLLATSPFVETVPWSSIYFFWGDERCVPPDHADSNYLMAYETLLSKVPVPAKNIFRIPAERDDPAQAAREYAETVQAFFLDLSASDRTLVQSPEIPRFDLIFLGMGADGHTASLFPHTAALDNDRDLVVANYVDKFQSHRITFTAPVLTNARNVTFLVAGADKADAVKEVIDGERQPHLYPSQLVRPRRGALLWMMDEGAASLV